ncbi:MAG: helix-turn-helix transcriptional regulator [Clostridia bacterium]|nr:helix-turn-helix transcriptional regulator [Clostridia bacterium]
MENRLEELRKEKGITQEELADKMSVSRQTIISLEKGRYNPSIILAYRISNYFQVNVEEVFLNREVDIYEEK